ncbi:MAG: hypothetical protein LT071_02940 [Nocardioides sp.]|nr:hypothetical protein [Nocardioides sp.]
MRLLLALLLTAPLLSGCVGTHTTIALLVADANSATRTLDAEAFAARVEAACEDCEVEVHDAAGVEAEQQSQVRQAVTGEADLIVIEPVSPEDAEGYAVGETPVVSLVTLVPGSDRFVGLTEPVAAGEGAQTSDLEAARALVLGTSKEMVHVPSRAIAEQGADVALGLLADTPVADGEDHEGVQSWLYEAVTITLDNLTTELVGNGVITLEDLCAGETAKRCQALGFV